MKIIFPSVGVLVRGIFFFGTSRCVLFLLTFLMGSFELLMVCFCLGSSKLSDVFCLLVSLLASAWMEHWNAFTFESSL